MQGTSNFISFIQIVILNLRIHITSFPKGHPYDKLTWTSVPPGMIFVIASL